MKAWMGWYAVLNISLGTSYVLTYCSRRFFSRALGLSALQWRQLIQASLLLSLFGPLFFHWVPSHPLPNLGFQGVLADDGPVSSKLKTISQTAVLPKAQKPGSGHGLGIPLSARGLDLSELLQAALVLGALFSAVRLLYRRYLLWRCLRHSLILHQVGRVRIALASDLEIPFSALVRGQAWIVLPASLVAYQSDFKVAIQHEVQHHRSRDTAWAVGLEWLSVLFFLNPFVYFWKREISEYQELSCDEILIGRERISTYEYGSCLVRVAEAALGSRRRFVGTTAMSSNSRNPNHLKSFLGRRIEMLVEKTKRRHPSRGKVALVGTLLSLFTMAVAYGSQQTLLAKKESSAVSGKIAVDDAVQSITDNLLAKTIAKHKARSGFLVAMDPTSGRVLAVSNQDDSGKSKAQWALARRLEPASVMKAVIAAAAIDRGATSSGETHECGTKATIGGFTFGDWKNFGQLSTAQTVIQSSNLCGIKVAQKLGAPALIQSLKDFGFGPNGSAKGVPGARPGSITSISDDDENFVVASIGTGFRGFYVTPIEVVNAFSAIANGGNRMKVLPADAPDEKVKVEKKVLSAATVTEMKAILSGVLTDPHGTAHESQSKLYKLAGKTGTAYDETSPDRDTQSGQDKVASFAGFGPVDNPRVAIYVAIMNPGDKEPHGSFHAAPLFKEAAEEILKHFNVPPSI